MSTSPVLPNRYRLLHPLGVGSMGAVYSVFDRLTGKTVALKSVMTSRSHNDDTAMRLSLTREFRTLAGLRHPNIIHVIDYGFDAAHTPFFTMELLEQPLSLLEAGQNQPFAVKIEYLTQLLQALAYLHRRGIIHRDLKPDNVKIVGGQVKVLDFGLAVAQEHVQSEVAGTIAYMAPEILENNPPSEQSDLYAVGMIAYELLTGVYPFPFKSVNRLVASILNLEVDLSPLSEYPRIMRLVGDLLAKSPALRPFSAYDAITRLREAVDLPHSPETVEIRDSFLQTARFVGREAELAQLIGAVDSALAGRGSAWCVGGESGVGKSRLLEELRVYALGHGMIILRGQTTAEGGLPYQLWVEPLRRLVLETQLDDFTLGVLKQIIPDLSKLIERDVPDIPILTGQAYQQRLIQAVLHIFRQVKTPVLLLQEDLQWAIESMSLVKPVVEITESLPLLVVGTYRNDERPDLIHEINAPQIHWMTLARLQKDDISKLSAAMLGEVGELPQIVDLLNRETEGNAFFLVEVVRTLAEEAGELSEIGRKTIPEQILVKGIEQIISHRLARMPQETQPLLRLAAVSGRQIDVLVMTHLAGEYPEMLLTSGVNTSVFDVIEGTVRFAHDKLRDALLRDLTPEEIPLLYGQVAEAVEAVYPEDRNRAAMLCDYWFYAGDYEKSARYAVIAYSHLIDMGHYTAARPAVERSLPRAKEPRNRLDLLKMMGQIVWREGEYQIVERVSRELLDIAHGLGDRIYEAHGLRLLGNAAYDRGDLQMAHDYVTQALYASREANDLMGIGNALLSLGNVYADLGDVEKCLAHYRESRDIFDRIGDSHGVAIIIGNEATIIAMSGDEKGAIAQSEEALRRSREMGDLLGISLLLGNLAEFYINIGQVEKAHEAIEEALRNRLNIGDRAGIARMESILAHCYQLEGNCDAALSYARSSLALGRIVDNAVLLMTVLKRYALIAIGCGEPHLEWIQEGLETAHQLQIPHMKVEFLTMRMVSELDYGDLDAVEKTLVETFCIPQYKDDAQMLCRMLVALAELKLRQGDPEACAEIVESLTLADQYPDLHRRLNGLRTMLSLHNPAWQDGSRLTPPQVAERWSAHFTKA